MDDLVKIFKVYGGVIKSKMLVSEIIERRYLLEDIKTVPHLYQVLREAHDKDSFWTAKGDGAILENIDKVFCACRMFTNNEVNQLFFAIRLAELVLKKNGVLVIDAKSEHERNLILKYLYRSSGSVTTEDSDVKGGRVTNVWEKQSEDFIFRKNC